MQESIFVLESSVPEVMTNEWGYHSSENGVPLHSDSHVPSDYDQIRLAIMIEWANRICID